MNKNSIFEIIIGHEATLKKSEWQFAVRFLSFFKLPNRAKTNDYSLKLAIL